MLKPRHSGEYPDREIDCQEAISGKLVEAIDEAEAAGWSRIEAAQALFNSAAAILAGETGTDPEE